jgi:membrane-associated phospholipid phosphatase
MDPWYLVTLAGEPAAWIFSTVMVFALHMLLRKKLSPKNMGTDRRMEYVYIPSIIFTLLVVLAVKTAIPIERPCTPCVGFEEACNPYCGTDNSFPSGHSAAIFAGVTSLCIGFRDRRLALLYLPAGIVASSRYFLGVHTVADVIAGAAVGIAVPFVFSLIYKKKFENPA